MVSEILKPNRFLMPLLTLFVSALLLSGMLLGGPQPSPEAVHQSAMAHVQLVASHRMHITHEYELERGVGK